eukprot:scaffold33263_cov70-Cyclotella_meneghiniana.AAC.9
MPSTTNCPSCGSSVTLKYMNCYFRLGDEVYRVCSSACFNEHFTGATTEELAAARQCTYVDTHGNRCHRTINPKYNNGTMCVNLCAPHHSAKKSGGDIEAGVAAFNKQAAQINHRLRSDQRVEKNHLWQEAITEMTDNAFDGGFSTFLASCISVVANVKDFNTVKDVEDPLGDNWIKDDAGYPSSLGYVNLTDELKQMIGHSDHYERMYRSKLSRGIIPKEKEPGSVYATANPANATSWMVSHWIGPVRQYVKNTPSCFVVVAGESFIKVYMLWWFSYHGEYNNFHQIMWGQDKSAFVRNCDLLAKTGSAPTTATACTVHHFPLGKNERFDETTFLFNNRVEELDELLWCDGQPGVILNWPLDDERITWTKRGPKTTNFDPAKMVGRPSFDDYFSTQDAKPAAAVAEEEPIESPLILDSDDVEPAAAVAEDPLTLDSDDVESPFVQDAKLAAAPILDSDDVESPFVQDAKPAAAPILDSDDVESPFVQDAKPAAAPILNSDDVVSPSINLQPKLSAFAQGNSLPFAAKQETDPYQTPKSTTVDPSCLVDLTDDPESPGPTKKAKMGDYHSLFKCGGCGVSFDFLDEFDEHPCELE